MDFSLTGEQEVLRAVLRTFLADRHPFATRRATVDRAPGWSAQLWRGFSEELGILGVGIPEAAGGMGGSAVETMIVMEELGESLVVEPFLETVVVAGNLLAGATGRERELARIVAGEARYALAWAEPDGRYRFDGVATRASRSEDGWVLSGRKTVVTAAPWATDLLVTARTAGEPGDAEGVSLFLLDPAAADVTVHAYRTIDGRQAAEIGLHDVRLRASSLVGEEGTALPRIERAGDAAIAGLAAEAVGVMRRLIQDTIDYTAQRRQFGQPIASFQALQHRIVDMYMQLELATSATYLATLHLEAPPAARALAASTAKVTVGRALRFVGQNAIQLHGGMGMTDDLAVGHYFRRATVIESEFGSTDFHRARHSQLMRAA